MTNGMLLHLMRRSLSIFQKCKLKDILVVFYYKAKKIMRVLKRMAIIWGD